MKYAQLITGLLIGTALGGSVVASTGGGAGGMSKEAIRDVVRQVISDEPQLILESVQKYQQGQQAERDKASNEALKDASFQATVVDSTNEAFVGPKDAKYTVVEFFDYNCPVCKSQFESLDKLHNDHKDVKIIFREFPIFGETSEMNSRIGLAIWHNHQDKYYEFLQRMMKGPGHAGPEATWKVLNDMGLDVEKLKAEAADKKFFKIVEANRQMAGKLNIQGTPTMIINGDQFIPHGIGYDELEGRTLKKTKQ